MRILIFSWRGPGHPHFGGAEIATHEHAKGWVNAGHEVTLFTSYFSGGKVREIVDGVEIIRRGSEVFGVQVAAFLWYILEKHENYDVVVDQFHGIPFFTPIFVRGKKIAYIHEVAKEVWKLNPWPRPFNTIPFVVGTMLEPFIFKLLYKSTLFMTVSQSTKNDLEKWGIPKKNIVVIYNGFTKIEKKFKREKATTVIYLGALSKDKGIEEAIEVFSLINKLKDNCKFWVVGKGETQYLRFLKLRAKELSLDRIIKFWGFVSEEKKFELLGRADIMLNPSVREGWGLVNIEANSMGVPVVGYNVSGVKDSVINNKTGLLCSQGDVEKLAKNCIELMSNRNKYNKFQKNAIMWSKKFDWKSAQNKSLNLLKSL
ncbi:MAG TPA: glycosyltransferase family 4 protein [Patescibacteria group bacterium]